jgi:hypothetical protein
MLKVVISGKHLSFPPLVSSSQRPSRFDHVLNHWNSSDCFNIKNNIPSDSPEPPCYEPDEMEVDVLQFDFTLEEGELPPDPKHPPPSFNGDNLRSSLRAFQFLVDVRLADDWSNVEDFLWKRYGLRELSGQAGSLPESFPMRLGLCKGVADTSVAELFNSVVDSTPLPAECDISNAYHPVDHGFPRRSPNSVLGVRPLGGGYLVTIEDGVYRPWRLYVEDPLTILQIEREGWDIHGDRIVSNLVQKGLPFQVLYAFCQKESRSSWRAGPVVHPEGKSPTYDDYLAYRLDLAHFFERYPHAYAAALCAGGILWRVALDVLPPPAEDEIIRPFHFEYCSKHIVDGQRYWTPLLTQPEEEVIVGVYMWAGKPNQEKVSTQVYLQPLDPGQTPKHDSWWPKASAWDNSGLDFGAWAPADEAWYLRRKRDLADGFAKAVQARDWKGNIKFERPKVARFLPRSRSLARSFITDHRL